MLSNQARNCPSAPQKRDQTLLCSLDWHGCSLYADMDFLQALPADMYYFANIRANEKIFLEKPEVGVPEYQGQGRPPTKECVLSDHKLYQVRELAKYQDLPWREVKLGEGAKGPLLARMACIRVYPSRDGLPCDQPVWLVIRIHEDGKVQYAFSNAPETMPFEEIFQASCMPYPIKQCFQESKSYLGMDDYEHRSWPAWHRHMLYVMLAQHFLILVQNRFKKTPELTVPQAKMLVETIFAKRSLTTQGIIEILEYIRRRNYIAYQSH